MIEQSIDINCDMGEGLNNEAQIMPYISSCNIACGGHAGDLKTMGSVIALAKQYGVKIGAHPSFPDRQNFGRLPLNMSSADLFSSLKQQLRAFIKCLKEQNAHLNHIKPHGALYNLAVHNEKIAQVMVEALKGISKPVKLYAPNASVLADLARAQGITVLSEGFADRRYKADLSLLGRKEPLALLELPEEVLSQVLNMLTNGYVETAEGLKKRIKVDTICVHGDHRNTIEILKLLQQELSKNNIVIR